jgi:hypothetical protein
MILVYGQPDDAPLARTLGALQEAGASYLLLSQTALAGEAMRIEIGPQGIGGMLSVAGQRVALDEIRSVYARPLDLPAVPADPTAARRSRLLQEGLLEWLDAADALIVNRPRAMQSNASKSLQIQLIAEHGFLVPETLVTSNPGEARDFWERHRRVVFKSASGIRSIVQELDRRNAARLPRLAALPVQFQAYVPGVDVRVHVVGRQTFAAEIESPVVDYRYAAREGAAAILTARDLPAAIRERCVALAAGLDLPLAGVDLRRRPDGEHVCFEVNPMPAYTYFQDNTGLPIAQAVAELLIMGDTTEVAVVQMVENQTVISGTVVARKPHATLGDYDVVTVRLEGAEPVPGKADLLGAQMGKTLEVSVRRALLGNAGPGTHLRCKAKRTLDGAMCEPHPASGDLEIR